MSNEQKREDPWPINWQYEPVKADSFLEGVVKAFSNPGQTVEIVPIKPVKSRKIRVYNRHPYGEEETE